MNEKIIENIVRKVIKKELEKYFGPKNGNLSKEDKKLIYDELIKNGQPN